MLFSSATNKHRKSPPPPAPVDLNGISIMWLPNRSLPKNRCGGTNRFCEFLTWGLGQRGGGKKVVISFSCKGRSLITILHRGRLNYSSSLVNPESKWLWGQPHAHLHMHTDEHFLLGEAGVAHSSTPPRLFWKKPPIKGSADGSKSITKNTCQSFGITTHSKVDTVFATNLELCSQGCQWCTNTWPTV